MKNFYISKQVAQRVAPALVDSRTTEVLPSLENIFLEGLESSEPVQEGIRQFVAARQVTGHPIAVTCWERHEEDSDDGDCDPDDRENDEDEVDDDNDNDDDDWFW